MLPIDRLSLIQISTEILGRNPGTHTHNSDDRSDDGYTFDRSNTTMDRAFTIER